MELFFSLEFKLELIF